MNNFCQAAMKERGHSPFLSLSKNKGHNVLWSMSPSLPDSNRICTLAGPGSQSHIICGSSTSYTLHLWVSANPMSWFSWEHLTSAWPEWYWELNWNNQKKMSAWHCWDPLTCHRRILSGNAGNKHIGRWKQETARVLMTWWEHQDQAMPKNLPLCELITSHFCLN